MPEGECNSLTNFQRKRTGCKKPFQERGGREGEGEQKDYILGDRKITFLKKERLHFLETEIFHFWRQKDYTVGDR